MVFEKHRTVFSLWVFHVDGAKIAKHIFLELAFLKCVALEGFAGNPHMLAPALLAELKESMWLFATMLPTVLRTRAGVGLSHIEHIRKSNGKRWGSLCLVLT